MPVKADTMTSRQRIGATITGDEVDRFPVWLKMANPTWRPMQPESIRKLDDVTLLREAGCDVMVGLNVTVYGESPHVEKTVDTTGTSRITNYETPDGPIMGRAALYPSTKSWHPVEFMVSAPEELKRLRWVYKDTRYTVDEDSVEAARRRKQELVAADVYTMDVCSCSPFMSLINHLMGPPGTYFLLQDEPKLFEEVLEEMHQDKMRMLRALLPHVQADTFWISEDTSTTLLSPGMFKRFCVPYLRAYGALIRDLGGVVAAHHMCGTLSDLLEMIDDLPAQVSEAFTTRPLGDVSLSEGRTRMPGKALWGGTNAVLWLEEPETIIETVAEDLAACPDKKRIFLTSAGVLPPMVSFDKARTVVDGLKSL